MESGFFHYLPEQQPVFTFLFCQLALCHEHGFFCDVGFPAQMVYRGAHGQRSSFIVEYADVHRQSVVVQAAAA